VKAWLDAHPPDGPVLVSYFGSGDIDSYGIHGTRIGDANFDLRQRKRPAILTGGLWIISVTQFQQVYTEARGPWDRAKEASYRSSSGPRPRAREDPRADVPAEGVTFEEYQFARLCHYLQGTKPPLAEPAYTFLIYQLTDAEVLKALYGPVDIP
jgi:hypothetical protein